MAYSMSRWNTGRLRSYLRRIPLATRLLLVLILLFWLAGLQSRWDVVQWGALVPGEVGLKSMYRSNTFPLVHTTILHTLFNLVALVPLLERFEAGHGSLVTIALFYGPLSTLPAGFYIFIERFLYGGNTPAMGASVWICALLAIETAKTYRSNPYFNVGGYRIPTWLIPFIVTTLFSFLIPDTSLLMNICGVAVGMLFGLGYLRYLSPPQKPLRWIEAKLNLLGRLPHYVSVDQKTYGRYGVLPSSSSLSSSLSSDEPAIIPLSYRSP